MNSAYVVEELVWKCVGLILSAKLCVNNPYAGAEIRITLWLMLWFHVWWMDMYDCESWKWMCNCELLLWLCLWGIWWFAYLTKGNGQQYRL
jgi:hypothetical protein